MESFGLTDVGCRRSVNQDAFYIDKSESIFMVADGMGGHQAGDLASRLAIRSIIDFLEKQVSFEGFDQSIEETVLIQMELCRSAVVFANNELQKIAVDHSELAGMGTTIDMLKVINGYAVICHVGDSRIYRIANGVIEQLTKDHTQIQEMIDQKQISRQEAESSSINNVITRALGGSEDVEVDTLVLPVRKNDVFLLCSDGLSSMMEDWEIFEEYGMYDNNLENAVKGFIETALERGAPDNVTVVIAGPADEEESISQDEEMRNNEQLKDNPGLSYLG
jgi:PPM family protein phosphatase